MQTLNENPYLTSTSLWKQIKYSEDDEAEPEVTAAELKWTKLDEAKEVSENATFFKVRCAFCAIMRDMLAPVH